MHVPYKSDKVIEASVVYVERQENQMSDLPVQGLLSGRLMSLARDCSYADQCEQCGFYTFLLFLETNASLRMMFLFSLDLLRASLTAVIRRSVVRIASGWSKHNINEALIAIAEKYLCRGLSVQFLLAAPTVRPIHKTTPAISSQQLDKSDCSSASLSFETSCR